MPSLGDASAVERLANLYDNAASDLARIGRERAREIDGADWQAPAAQRYRSAAHRRTGDCDRNANEMQDMARSLRQHARWIRETEAELRNLERRIRSWAASHPPNPADPAPDASLITWWPASLSPDWRSLAARLRANGAHF